MPSVAPRPPKARKKRGKVYFSKLTEDAIIRYNREKNPIVRNAIFNAEIVGPFKKLAENVLNTFKFSYFDDRPENIQHEVVSFMVEKIHHYNPKKGKAFSYFSIVAKNYLILLNGTNYKRLRSHDAIDAVDTTRNFHSETRDLEKNEENKEFICLLVAFWENNVSAFFKRARDVQIANSIVEALRKVEVFEEFNKKALYTNIKEICAGNGLRSVKTQQITKVINIMRENYRDMARTYQRQGSVPTENIHSNRFF